MSDIRKVKYKTKANSPGSRAWRREQERLKKKNKWKKNLTH